MEKKNTKKIQIQIQLYLCNPVSTGPGKFHVVVLVSNIICLKQKRDVLPKPLLCMLKFRGNKMNITINNLLMSVRTGIF